MVWLRKFAASAGRAKDELRLRADALWALDLTRLSRGRALAVHLGRIVSSTLRGLFKHQLGLRAAALSYYTMFSIVPVLVLALWIWRVLHLLPEGTVPTGERLASSEGNDLLRAALQRILATVGRTSRITSGVLGTAALLYGAIRLFIYVEHALNAIAESERRRLEAARLLGFVALLLLPPALLLVAGLLTGLMHGLLGSSETVRFLGEHPAFKLAGGVVLGVGTLWLALTIFYTAAARARIPLRSAAVGALVGALLLPAVLWAFAEFQIGVSRSRSLEAGLAAAGVFLLWTFASWYVVLIGAEIAVAHGQDRRWIHGRAPGRSEPPALDPYPAPLRGRQQTSN